MKRLILPCLLLLASGLTAQFNINFLSNIPQIAAQPITVQNNPPYSGTQLFSATTVGSTYFNPNNLGYLNSSWGDDIQIPNSLIGNLSSANISQVRLGLYREANAPATKIDLFYGSINSDNSFTPVTRFAVFDLPMNGAANVVEILTVGDNSSTIFNVPLSDIFLNKKTFSLGMSISNSGANGWMLQNGGSSANFNAMVRYDTLNSNVGFVTFNPFLNPPNACFYSEVFGSATIPVTLRDFSGEVLFTDKNATKLVWQTATEYQNSGFEIEKSLDGLKFQKIGFVKGQGSTGGDYAFIDSDFDQKAYYRLKQLDEDGNFTYSKTIALAVKNGKNKRLEVYPNPSTDGRFIVKSGELPAGLQVINVQGQVIEQKNAPLSINSQIDLSGQPSGVYWLKNGSQMTKVVKN